MDERFQTTEGLLIICSGDKKGMVVDEGCDKDDKMEPRLVHGIRQLRLQLELCIGSNDELRQRLEDCARQHHSTRCSSCRRQLTALPAGLFHLFFTVLRPPLPCYH